MHNRPTVYGALWLAVFKFHPNQLKLSCNYVWPVSNSLSINQLCKNFFPAASFTKLIFWPHLFRLVLIKSSTTRKNWVLWTRFLLYDKNNFTMSLWVWWEFDYWPLQSAIVSILRVNSSVVNSTWIQMLGAVGYKICFVAVL